MYRITRFPYTFYVVWVLFLRRDVECLQCWPIPSRFHVRVYMLDYRLYVWWKLFDDRTDSDNVWKSCSIHIGNQQVMLKSINISMRMCIAIVRDRGKKWDIFVRIIYRRFIVNSLITFENNACMQAAAAANFIYWCIENFESQTSTRFIWRHILYNTQNIRPICVNVYLSLCMNVIGSSREPATRK